MTINGLPEFLRGLGVPKVGRSSQKDSTSPFKLETLRGKRIAIEASGLIHKQNWAAILAVSRQFPFIWLNQAWTMPANDEVLSMFKVMFRSMIKRIQGTGVIPIIVLEGKSPEAKEGTRKKRSEARADALRDAEESRRVPNLLAFQAQLPKAYPPGKAHVIIVRDLAMEMGIETYEAAYEAEGACAALVKHGLCDVALIDDYDIFMYGCKAVIRNMWRNKDGEIEVEGYALRDLLIAMDFQDPNIQDVDSNALARFRLLCALSGNDYSHNIPGLGINRIYDIILKNRIQTYDEACRIEPRFKEIPYAKIVDTIEANAAYSSLSK